ncbi:helix-turn-helix domain-containing protein [soil metagenome]
MSLDISQVAQRSGVPASALRFYEEKGLIASIGRRGLRRVFEEAVIERLSLIALGRVAGFSLDEIGAMFAPDDGPRVARSVLRAKADDLDLTIRRLTAMRDGLHHAADCPAPSLMACPHFQNIVRAAGAGKLKPRARPVFRAEAV